MEGSPALFQTLMLWWNALTFTLNACSLSGHLTSSQHPQSEVKVCDPKATGPPESLYKIWQLLASSSTNTPLCSQERVAFPRHRGIKASRAGSWPEEDRAPAAGWRQCSPQSYLGGGEGVKWPQRVPFSCPQTECSRECPGAWRVSSGPGSVKPH